MATKEIAECTVCGSEFEYSGDYKPKTCGKYYCLDKFLFPEKYNGKKDDINTYR